MNQKSKEFFEKLATLMEEYGVEIEITESCYGYGGFQVDGLEFAIPYTDEDYKLTDYVEFSGKIHSAEDIRKELDKCQQHKTN